MSAPLRIIARPVPWPSLAERPERSGLRLRWDALDETGALLAASTEWPLADGALALVRRGADPEALVTMRHEGATYDSFEPIPLRVPAKLGARRAAEAERVVKRLKRARHREEIVETAPTGASDANADNAASIPGFRKRQEVRS